MTQGSIINGFPNIQNKQIIAHEPLKQEYNFGGNAYSPVVELTHKASDVTAGTYGSNTTFPILTIDNYGHVTSAENSVPVNLLPSPANLPENSTMIVKDGKWTVQQEGWLPIAGTLYYDRARDSGFSTKRQYTFYTSEGDNVNTLTVPSIFDTPFLQNFYRVAHAAFVEISINSTSSAPDVPRYYFGVDEDLVYPYLGGSFTTEPQGVDNVNDNKDGRNNSDIILRAISDQEIPTIYTNDSIEFPTVWGKLIEKNSGSGFLGYKDWFLPSAKQLESIGKFMGEAGVNNLGESGTMASFKMMLLDQKIRDIFKLFCNIYRERTQNWPGYNNYLTSNLYSSENNNKCYRFGYNDSVTKYKECAFNVYNRACFLREI